MTGETIPKNIYRSVSREADDEAELVRGAKARSGEAWSEIYEQSHPKLSRYVFARVGDRQTAEDLTATVFLEALKSIDSYRSRGRPLLAWLYRIARNVVNYHYRSLFRKGTDFAAPREPAAAPAGEQADPASLVEGWDLRRAIARLSRDQREVIILRYFVGLTTPEVAALVGKHERAVYSLQTRAIKSLRRHLG